MAPFLLNQYLTEQNGMLEDKKQQEIADDSVMGSVLKFLSSENEYGGRLVKEMFAGEAVVWFYLNQDDSNHTVFWNKFRNQMAAVVPETAAWMKEHSFPLTQEEYHAFLSVMENQLKGRERLILLFGDVEVLDDGVVKEFTKNMFLSEIQNVTVLVLKEDMLKTIGPLGDDKTSGSYFVSHIRLTKEEIAQYYLKNDMTVSVSDLDYIYQYSEGWAFPVILFGVYLKRGMMVRQQTDEITQIIFRYFQREYFNIYPAEMQRCLVSTALLNKVSLNMARCLSEVMPEILLESVEQNPFIRYTTKTGNYHMHRMYRKFLLEKRVMLTAEDERKLFDRAGDWYQTHGEDLEALICHIKSESYDKIEKNLLSVNILKISKHACQQCLDALDSIPLMLQKRTAAIEIARAYVYYQLQEFHKCDHILQNLVEWLEALPERSETQSAALGEAYLLLGLRDFSFTEAKYVEYFAKARKLLPEGSKMISYQAQFYGHGQSVHYGGPNKGDLDKMVKAAFDSAEDAYHLFGKMHMLGAPYLAAGEAAYFRGDYKAVAQNAFKALAIGQEHDQLVLACGAFYLLVRIACAQGRYDKMKNYLSLLEEYGKKVQETERFTLPDVLVSWYMMRLGETERIEKIVQNVHRESQDIAPLYVGLERSAYATYCMMKKLYHEAIAYAESNIRYYLRTGNYYMALRQQLVKAICLNFLGDHELAFEEVLDAYSKNYELDVIMLFAELGKYMRTLIETCKRVNNGEIEEKWLDEIYTKASTYAKYAHILEQQYIENTGKKISPLDKLTKEETEILRLLAMGLSRNEIALNRCISINTVKGHLKRIYDKLNALNRSDAVRIAIANGLDLDKSDDMGKL